MKFYCMCTFLRGTDGPNREAQKAGAVVLKKPMRVERNGVEQFIAETDGSEHRHYPNVDHYVCDICGAEMMRE